MHICCILKPNAVKHEEAIAVILWHANLPVRERKKIFYTESLIHMLYDHMPDAAREAIAARYAGKQGVALRIESPSIDAVLELAGRESNPAKCAPHTIRARFGFAAPAEKMGDDPWWENAFHRPIDMREAVRDMECFFPAHKES